MHQFFVTPMQVKEDHIYIEGLDVNHIKNVLRMKVGEALKVSDGNNRKYLCEIESMTAQQVCIGTHTCPDVFSIFLPYL